MDPFEKLPEEIHDEILKNFSTDELLHNLSLVSHKWYEIIGKSVICMDKVKLNFRAKRKTIFEERIETLKWMSRKNSRKYISIQANCLLSEEVTKEFWSFLQHQESLVNLNVRSMKLDFDVTEDLMLPKLEYLKVMFIPREIVNRLIVSTTKLKKLILWAESPLSYDEINYLPNSTTVAAVKKCLESNENIDELEVQGRANFYALYHYDLSRFTKCKLKKLTIKIEMPPKNLTDLQLENILKFLHIQKDTLQYFYIDKCISKVFEFAFNNQMPNLETFRCDVELHEKSIENDVKDLKLVKNEKITNFELAYVKLFDDLKIFLELLPNVKEILVGHMNPRLMTFVANDLLHLESLIYRYDDCAGGCEAVYENMKKEQPELKNKSIKLSICNDFL